MARIPKPKDNWPSRRELIKIVQQQDELIGQQNIELAELRAKLAEEAACAEGWFQAAQGREGRAA